MTEVEIKLCLTEKDYIRCGQFFAQEAQYLSTQEQENFYFDTLDYYFISRSAMFRLRRMSNRIILTIKDRASCTDGCFRCQENEYDLKIEHQHLWQCDIEGLLLFLQSSVQVKEILTTIDTNAVTQGSLKKTLDHKKLIALGSLYNKRDIYCWQGLKIELDRSNFGSHDDFELECETPQPLQVAQQLQELFKRLSIVFVPQTKSKFRRFLEQTKKTLASGEGQFETKILV